MSDDDFDEDDDDEDEDEDDEDASPQETRAATLERLRMTARRAFKRAPELSSVMLCVAQYWNDEAEDAVHSYVVASSRPTPVWPHVCHDDTEVSPIEKAGDEFCDSCHGEIGLGVDDNGSAIAAFQAYCHENGSQDETYSDNYTPYAVARRVGSKIEIEKIGVLYRPYEEMLEEEERTAAKVGAKPLDARAKELFLQACASADDGPRRVLADYLLEQDDPRGEYISLALSDVDVDQQASARRDALLAEHAWSWIHPLATAIPRDRAVFERGLLAAADAFVTDEDIAACENALAWASVERLHFLPGSSDFVSAVMTSALREVGPLATNGLAKLVKAKQWAIEKLHVSIGTPTEIDHLVASRLPALRRLVIEYTTEGFPLSRLVTAAWWKQLERVTWIGAFTHAPEWCARLQEIEPVPWIAICDSGADGRPAGWDIAVGRSAIEVSYVGWFADATRTQLLDVLARLPALPVALVASPIWTPTEDDTRTLGHHAKRVVTIKA